jgi:hypothetical protein
MKKIGRYYRYQNIVIVYHYQKLKRSELRPPLSFSLVAYFVFESFSKIFTVHKHCVQVLYGIRTVGGEVRAKDSHKTEDV